MNLKVFWKVSLSCLFFFFLSLGNRMLSNSLPTPGCCFVQLVRSLLTVETAFPCPMPAGRRQDS